MQIDLLFFGAYRELFGSERRAVVLPDASTAGTLVASLRHEAGGPASLSLPPGAAVVVNHRVVGPDHPIHEGDEVALLPPVAGG